MKETEKLIRGMGFDAGIAADLLDIVRISAEAGREKGREECLAIVEQFGQFDGPESVKMFRSMCSTAIAEKIRALSVTRPDGGALTASSLADSAPARRLPE